jgi:hypothetical protein
MIGRKQHVDVFVLGEEALAGVVPLREVGGAAVPKRPKRRERQARGGTDPFRIDIDRDRPGSETPAGEPASDAAALENGEETVEHRGSEGGEWLQPKRDERQGWRRPGGVAVAAVTAAVAVGVMGSAKLMGGPGREAADPPVEAVETPPRAYVAPPTQLPARADLKRDSRPRRTRGREGQTSRPRASSTGRPVAAAPSIPVAAAPSPPSQGGGSGDRDNFGFEG